MNPIDFTPLLVLAYLFIGTLGIALLFGWALRRAGQVNPPPKPGAGLADDGSAWHARNNRAARQRSAS